MTTTYRIGDSVTVENEVHTLEGVIIGGTDIETGETILGGQYAGTEIDETGTFRLRCLETGETLKVRGWLALDIAHLVTA